MTDPVIYFRRPVKNRLTFIAMRGEQPIARIDYYRSQRFWLAHSLGADLDLGGTHGHPGVKAFKTLALAKQAIIEAPVRGDAPKPPRPR